MPFILSLHRSAGLPSRELALRYETTLEEIDDVLARRTWGNVPDALPNWRYADRVKELRARRREAKARHLAARTCAPRLEYMEDGSPLNRLHFDAVLADLLLNLVERHPA